jgi:hypothetical protein
VSDQQASTITNVDDDSLVPGTVVVISQQAPHEASDLYPATIIALFVGFVHPMPCCCFWGRHSQSATKNAASHFWLAA